MADVAYIVGPIENLRQFDDGNIRFEVQGNEFSINPTRFTFHKPHLAPLTAAYQTQSPVRVGYKVGKQKNDGGYWLNISSLAVDDGTVPPSLAVPQAAPVAIAGIPMAPGAGAVAQVPQAIPQAAPATPPAQSPVVRHMPTPVSATDRDASIRASVALKAAVDAISPIDATDGAQLAPYMHAVSDLAHYFNELLQDITEGVKEVKDDDDGELIDMLQRSLDATVVEE